MFFVLTVMSLGILLHYFGDAKGFLHIFTA